MVPEATLGHLAEVFLGGLMREVADTGGTIDSEHVRYDFFDGVRERLLDSASVEEVVGVLDKVSEYVVDHLGSTLDFRAWLADPSGVREEMVAVADLPFARIGASVLQRLGGEYAKLAALIGQRLSGEQSPTTILSPDGVHADDAGETTSNGLHAFSITSPTFGSSRSGRWPSDERSQAAANPARSYAAVLADPIEQYSLLGESVGLEAFEAQQEIGSQVPVAASQSSGTRVHVLIITAFQDEFDGVRSIHDGVLSDWESRRDSVGSAYHLREYKHASGAVMRVALARPVDMGASLERNVATQLVNELRPVCLAMSGICAGRRGEVSLGDVIVASRLVGYEAGELKAITNADGERVEEMLHEIITANLDPRWQHRAEDWPRSWCDRWQAERPRAVTYQENWLLDALLRHEQGQGERPETHPERHTQCSSWKDVILRLRKRGLLTQTGLALTDDGRTYVEEQWLLHRGRMPDEKPLRVHVAPMATVGNVKQAPAIFGQVLKRHRKVMAVDMESVAIGLVAALEQLPYTLVVKAVQDYGDHDKDDSLRHFGTRIAAAFLLDFLRENLPADVLDPSLRTLKDYLSSEQAALRSQVTPATFLVSRHQVVPFAGRETELDTLDRWADSGDVVRVLLVHGPGGIGKTRLLTEWLARRAARRPGDAIGFLTGPLDDAVINALCASERAIVVIDYAEGRAGLDALLMRLASVATRESGVPEHVRLVLLARHADDWWASLRGRSSDMAAFLDEPPLELAPLTRADQDARLAEYRRAHAAFAHALQRRPMDARPAGMTDLNGAPDLRAWHFERPLYVHMAALTAALGKPQAGAPRDILDAILDYEQRYWAHYLGMEPDNSEWRQRVEQVRQAAAAIVVRGRCAREDLPAVMQALGFTDTGPICTLLQDLYPDPDPTRSRTWVVSVEPDLVAEALLCSVLERRGRPEEWLINALTGIEPLHWENAFTMLGRMGVGYDATMARVGADAARTLLSGDVAGRAEAAFSAALALTAHTAHSDLGRILADALRGGEHVVVARALDGRVPDKTVSLRELAVSVDEILLASLGEHDDLEERARRSSDLGVRYRGLGRREAALQATEQALKLYEGLVAMHPDTFLPHLATNLSNLGSAYSELGRWEESLGAAERAVEICEELTKKRPDGFGAHLARSLNNLGAIYRNLGRREEALLATSRAVKMREELAAKRPEAFSPDLATSLSNLGMNYRELGRQEEALRATAHAVALYEELAAKRPDAFLPHLARSLNNLGNTYIELGRQEEALRATERAMRLHEELAAKRPGAFLSDLARSLNNLGALYGELGRREEALLATERAVQLHEELAATRPGVFLPDLARSLSNLGAVYGELGRREEALLATERAVKLHEELAATRPDAFLPNLATSLNNLGNTYGELGRQEEALLATERAVMLHEELAATRPDVFLPDLARSLNNLGALYGELGRQEKALLATERAVKLHEELAATRPDVFLPDLAKSLNNLVAMYGELGRLEDMLLAMERAVTLYEELAVKLPDAFLPDLARSLNNLGAMYGALARREDALRTTERAVRLHEDLAATRPDVFLPDLARSLNNLGVRYNELGRLDEAQRATERAVEIQEELAAKLPDAFLPDLVRSLSNLSSMYNEPEEALGAKERAVEILDELAAKRPDTFLPELAATLNNLGSMYNELGMLEEALGATERAVVLLDELAAKRPEVFLPDFAASLNNLGAIYSALGRQEEALVARERAAQLREKERASMRQRVVSEVLAYFLSKDEPPKRHDAHLQYSHELIQELIDQKYLVDISGGDGQALILPSLRGFAILPYEEIRRIVNAGDLLLAGMERAYRAGTEWCGVQELLPWCAGLSEEDARQAIVFLRELNIWKSWPVLGRVGRVQLSQGVLKHPTLSSKIAELRQQLGSEQAAVLLIESPETLLERAGSIAAVPALPSPRLFISYSHDSPEHARRVFDLANHLRAEGVDAWIDQYELAPAQGWPRWMQQQIEQADFILLVCTATYRRRFEGSEDPGQSKGVTWEGLLAQQQLYDSQTRNERLIPVLFDEEDEEAALPMILRPYMRYRIPSGYEGLYRRLTGQAAVLVSLVGPVRAMPPHVSPVGTDAVNVIPSEPGTEQVTIGPLPTRSTGLPDRPSLAAETPDRAPDEGIAPPEEAERKPGENVSKRAALEKLLMSLFDIDGLKRWLVLEYPDIQAELPSSRLSRVSYVHEAVEMLGQHIEIEREFFERLIAVRPGRAKDIRAVRDAWLDHNAEIGMPLGRADSPQARATRIAMADDVESLLRELENQVGRHGRIEWHYATRVSVYGQKGRYLKYEPKENCWVFCAAVGERMDLIDPQRVCDRGTTGTRERNAVGRYMGSSDRMRPLLQRLAYVIVADGASAAGVFAGERMTDEQQIAVSVEDAGRVTGESAASLETSDIQHVLVLTRDALQMLEQDNDVRLSTVVQKCIRIARLTNDLDSLWWLRIEMIHVGTMDSIDSPGALTELDEDFPDYYSSEKFWDKRRAFVKEYLRDRTVWGAEKVDGSSLPELEVKLASLSAEVADSDAELEQMRQMGRMRRKDLRELERVNVKYMPQLIEYISNCQVILQRVRHRLYEFLTRKEITVIREI